MMIVFPRYSNGSPLMML